ncbi:hypothetical protein F3Y22_tig00110418pilonHSYRG00293 [Hibiscus syriacus]|uniref:NAC domain-containing protein n=1 Tax=Hibiscus syriacus TaxID=106335 RepID=A0A6A3ASB8_HIBSY|nr:hypothetical protein F3Y22_tig00110418pilonHSYRG00293 [Hibiscus syriacus]
MDWRKLFRCSINHHLKYFPPNERNGVPTVHPPPEVFEGGISEWKHSLVGQVLGSAPNFATLQRIIEGLWKKPLQGANIQVSYLDPTSICFPSNLKLHETGIPILVHLYNVPLELFSNDGLSYIASAIGFSLSMDSITASKTRLEFAKVCVEIEASDVIPKSIDVVLNTGNQLVYELPPSDNAISSLDAHSILPSLSPLMDLGKPPKVKSRNSVAGSSNSNSFEILNSIEDTILVSENMGKKNKSNSFRDLRTEMYYATITMQRMNAHFLLNGIYGHNDGIARRSLWQDMRNIESRFPDCPWILGPLVLPTIAWHWLTQNKEIELNRPKPFKFFNCWTLHQNFLNIVSHSWHQASQGNPLKKLFLKLRRLKVSLKNLNKNYFSDISAQVRIKREEIEKQQILTLRVKDCSTCLLKDLLQPISSPEYFEGLTKEVTNEEIKEAIFSQGNDKAPGPDDLLKAFDSIHWGLIPNILKALEFPSKLIDWIIACYSTASYSIAFNGSLIGFFKGAKGLRQGNLEYVMGVIIVLDYFYEISGLKLNALKCEIFTTGISVLHIENIINSSSFKHGILPVRYLGIPLVTRKLSIKDCQPLIDKIKSKLYQWSRLKLSYAGNLYCPNPSSTRLSKSVRDTSGNDQTFLLLELESHEHQRYLGTGLTEVQQCSLAKTDLVLFPYTETQHFILYGDFGSSSHQRFGLATNDQCILRFDGRETINHLFAECKMAASIWNSILLLSGIHKPPFTWSNLLVWTTATWKGDSLITNILKLSWCAFNCTIWEERNRRIFRGSFRSEDAILLSIKQILAGNDAIPWNSVSVSLAWNIWKNRNELVFNASPPSIYSIMQKSMAWVNHYNNSKITVNSVMSQSVQWKAATIGHICLNVDGTCSSSTGSCSIGGWFNCSMVTGYEIIQVQSDYASAIRMLKDPTATINSLSLVRAILGLCNRAWAVDFKRIPIETNFPADALAKLASDSSSCSLVIHDTPPDNIRTLSIGTNLVHRIMGEKEWYFFSLRDMKYPTRLRINRAIEAGYWKAIRKDREIYSSKTSAHDGMKRTLKSGAVNGSSSSHDGGARSRMNDVVAFYQEPSSPSSISLPLSLIPPPFPALIVTAALTTAIHNLSTCPVSPQLLLQSPPLPPLPVPTFFFHPGFDVALPPPPQMINNSFDSISRSLKLLVLCLLVLHGVCGRVSGRGGFYEKPVQNRKMLLQADLKINKRSTTGAGNRENFRTVPSGPDPLHHNGGSPKKPRTDP